MLRVRQGDTVELTLKNSLTSKVSHSIDLHAVTGPGGGAKVTQVAPGESATFRWKALNPGVYVYHCATPMVPHHIANGMYGLIVVEPPEGLPPVDREFYVMQGDFYLDGKRDEPGFHEFSLENMLDERPSHVVFNGSVGAIAGAGALKAKVGETVRIFFGVGGPNVTSSFHALAEWGRLFIPIQETYVPEAVTVSLLTVRVLLLAAGFGALLQFGIELLPPRSRTRLRAVPPVLFAIWIGLTIGGGGALWDVDLTLAVAEVQARGLLALPAGLVCAAGLVLQQCHLLPLGGAPLLRWLRLAAVGAGLTGLALGLMVPPIGAWGGTDWLLGAPAELWRALAGALFALGLARTLAVFQLEQDRALEAAERQAIVAQTRQRLGRELSDRVAQHHYAVGLLLGDAVGHTPADAPLRRALTELDVSLDELRRFMQDGEAEARHGPAARWPLSSTGRRCSFRCSSDHLLARSPAPCAITSQSRSRA